MFLIQESQHFRMSPCRNRTAVWHLAMRHHPSARSPCPIQVDVLPTAHPRPTIFFHGSLLLDTPRSSNGKTLSRSTQKAGEFTTRETLSNQIAKSQNVPARARACNLMLRRRMPYPLGHRHIRWFGLLNS
jgi:hypothetical protein